MYELGSDKKVLSKSIAVSIQICIYLILYVLTYTKKISFKVQINQNCHNTPPLSQSKEGGLSYVNTALCNGVQVTTFLSLQTLRPKP